jgi:hypothetical protein
MAPAHGPLTAALARAYLYLRARACVFLLHYAFSDSDKVHTKSRCLAVALNVEKMALVGHLAPSLTGVTGP